MSVKTEVSAPKLVYSSPINSATKKWGVHAIPRMWREANGDLIVRLNGAEDNGLTQQAAPNLYFKSEDLGESWTFVENGPDIYDMTVFMGINPPYTFLKDGSVISLGFKKNCWPIMDVEPVKKYLMKTGANFVHVYKYGDIPDNAKGVLLNTFVNGEKRTEEVNYDFPEREIAVSAKGRIAGDKYLDLPEYVQSGFFWSPYMTGACELADGTLAALAHGQRPDVPDRQCEEVYLIASDDRGKTWRKRAVAASTKDRFPMGYAGDGYEISLTAASNGDLLCAMRMEGNKDTSDTMLTRSTDNGYSWSEPVSVADSSVTPHVVAMEDGVVLLIYGRPGVHFKISEDCGKTWSDSYPIIGKTLEEERKTGRSDREFKYTDMGSYSNTFIEKISENTVILVYNDMKYDEGDGQKHKAAFVRKITVTKN